MKFTRRKNDLMMTNRILTVVLAEPEVRWVAEQTGWSLEKSADEMLYQIIQYGRPDYQDHTWIVDDPGTDEATLAVGNPEEWWEVEQGQAVAYPHELQMGVYVGRVK